MTPSSRSISTTTPSWTAPRGSCSTRGTVVAKNNLAYNNLDNYNGTFSAASTNNLSGPAADPQIPATNKRDGVTVTFVNAPGKDFHLAGGDVGALDRGTNLSADLNLPIFLDIDHQSRVPVWTLELTTPVGPRR